MDNAKVKGGGATFANMLQEDFMTFRQIRAMMFSRRTNIALIYDRQEDSANVASVFLG